MATLSFLAAALLVSVGCAGFSQVNFGPENADKVREGDTIHQAIANYGKPDYIHDAKGDQLYIARICGATAWERCWIAAMCASISASLSVPSDPSPPRVQRNSIVSPSST